MRSIFALSFALLGSTLAACSSGNGAFGGYQAPNVCTSQSVAPDIREGSNMRPGGECIGCHSQGEGPIFSVAGTVMKGPHDDENCNGVSGASVEITGADGKVTTLTSNSAGNFSGRNAVAMPFTAKVKFNGKERAMASAQSNGDCNSCHTAAGTSGAPGRIELP